MRILCTGKRNNIKSLFQKMIHKQTSTGCHAIHTLDFHSSLSQSYMHTSALALAVQHLPGLRCLNLSGIQVSEGQIELPSKTLAIIAKAKSLQCLSWTGTLHPEMLPSWQQLVNLKVLTLFDLSPTPFLQKLNLKGSFFTQNALIAVSVFHYMLSDTLHSLWRDVDKCWRSSMCRTAS